MELKIDGYNVYRKDRIDTACGGVAILVKNDIPCSEIKINNITTNNEFIVLEIYLTDNEVTNSVTVSTIYCPHGNPSTDLIDNISKINLNSIIMGDFNSKHHVLGSSKINKSGTTLLNSITKNDLFLINDESPTHYNTPTDSFDVIDYIFSSKSLFQHLN